MPSRAGRPRPHGPSGRGRRPARAPRHRCRSVTCTSTRVSNPTERSDRRRFPLVGCAAMSCGRTATYNRQPGRSLTLGGRATRPYHQRNQGLRLFEWIVSVVKRGEEQASCLWVPVLVGVQAASDPHNRRSGRLLGSRSSATLGGRRAGHDGIQPAAGAARRPRHRCALRPGRGHGSGRAAAPARGVFWLRSALPAGSRSGVAAVASSRPGGSALLG